MEEAKDTRKVMQLGEWWEMFGDGTPELRRFLYSQALKQFFYQASSL